MVRLQVIVPAPEQMAGRHVHGDSDLSAGLEPRALDSLGHQVEPRLVPFELRRVAAFVRDPGAVNAASFQNVFHGRMNRRRVLERLAETPGGERDDHKILKVEIPAPMEPAAQDVH